MFTEMDLSTPAWFTCSTVAIRIDTHSVTQLVSGHLAADFRYDSGKLVSKYCWRRYFRRPLVTIIYMHICSADTTCFYLNHNIMCSSFWHRIILNPQIMFPIKHCTLHYQSSFLPLCFLQSFPILLICLFIDRLAKFRPVSFICLNQII